MNPGSLLIDFISLGALKVEIQSLGNFFVIFKAYLHDR